MEYWNPDDLSYIASAISKPVHVDKMTASSKRISYARICIEVSVEHDLLKTLEIGCVDPIYGDQGKVTLYVDYQ